MSRKDYELIAGVLRTARHTWELHQAREHVAACEAIAASLAHVLASHNMRFDGQRFIRACRASNQ